MLFVVICNHLFSMMVVSIFLSTQPQINTSVYPTIRIHLFAASKTQKIRGPEFVSKSSEKPYISSIFTLSIMYFSQQNHALNVGRDNALNVDTTREQIYPHSTREQIDRFTIRLHHSSAPNN